MLVDVDQIRKDSGEGQDSQTHKIVRGCLHD